MTEAVQEKIEGRHEAQARLTAFEPEVLAFCCEH